MFVVVYSTVDVEGGDAPSRSAGEILRVVKVSGSGDLALAAEEQLLDESEDFILHDAEAIDDDFDRTFKVANGVLELKAERFTQDELRVLVNKERERRLQLGAVIDGIRVSGTERNITNLNSLAMAAQILIASGRTDSMVFRDEDNVIHELLPAQMISLWMQASEIVTAIYARSWALKDNGPIPQDFAEDGYWT